MDVKHALLEACHQYAEDRIAQIERAMKTVQEAANEETKSSVGDKYETGRAMMQLERDKYAIQLSEALKHRKILEAIDVEQASESVQLGSLVTTSEGNFFLAIGAGKLRVADKSYFAISVSSPIGTRLINKKAGDQVEFNGKLFRIQGVC